MFHGNNYSINMDVVEQDNDDNEDCSNSICSNCPLISKKKKSKFHNNLYEFRCPYCDEFIGHSARAKRISIKDGYINIYKCCWCKKEYEVKVIIIKIIEPPKI